MSGDRESLEEPRLPSIAANRRNGSSEKREAPWRGKSRASAARGRSGPYRVMFVIPSLEYGGAERQLVELVNHLDKRHFQATVVSFEDGGPLEAELAETEGTTVVSLGKKKGDRDVRFIWRLIALARRLRPHVIHGYMNFSNLLALLAGKSAGAFVVWGIRGSNNREYAEFDAFEHAWFNFALRLSFLADLAIFNSRAGRDYYRAKGFGCRRTILVPNGIDIGRFKRRIDLRHRVRAEWGVGDNEYLIGLVARLHPMKEHQIFLNAAERLTRYRSDVRFVCVGSGTEDYARGLRKLTIDLGLGDRVIWAGSRSDMPAVHNALDISVSCSRFGEGFPNAIGESMACGVPCVVAGAGDTEWIVGDTGVVVAQGDAEALASGCDTLLDRLKTEGEALRQRCSDRIAEGFDTMRLADETEAALLALLEMDPSGRTRELEHSQPR